MESDDESIVLEKRDKMNVDVLLKNVWLYQTVTQTFVQRNVAIKNDKFMKKRTSICSPKKQLMPRING